MSQGMPSLRDMKIAVASQNRKNVTGHAGKCRKFWIYEAEGGAVKGRELLELPIEQSFHESARGAPHPLDGVQVLIAGGMGAGMRSRLQEKGILAVTTAETDLERAVAAWLDGSLVELPPEAHDHDHDHDHGHGHGHSVSITTLSADALMTQPLEDCLRKRPSCNENIPCSSPRPASTRPLAAPGMGADEPEHHLAGCVAPCRR